MSWAKKLAYKAGLKSKPDPVSGLSRPAADERIRDTLAQNPAIGGDQEIIQTIMSAGEVVGFHEGNRIIEQSTHGDDVYFLLAGEVDIVIDGRKRTLRTAPNQVGEMAAIEPGKARSATVRVRSETACALRVSGDVFRSVWSGQSDFKGRLQVEMASRHREQLAATRVANENVSLHWFILSVGVAIVVGALTWLSLEQTEWTLAARSVATGAAAIAAFIGVFLWNPTFFWRRGISFLLYCMIGKTVFDTAFSLEAQHGFGSLQISFTPKVGAVDLATSIGGSMPFLIGMAMFMVMEHLQSKK